MSSTRRDARLYLLAALAAVGGLLLRRFLDPLLGGQNSYPALWLAIVFSAWYCGVGPTVVAAAMGLLGIWFYPRYSVHDRTEIFGMLIFVVFSVVIILLGAITRRRTAKLADKIAEAEEKAEMLDLANDAIFVKTANGRISYWNQGAERLYGWTMSEALGHFPAELLHSEYPIPLREIESKGNWEGEIRHTTKDGKQIVVASRWSTLRAKDNKPVAWLEINTDVTSRKRAEASARSLSGRILTVQDEERRKIARALHDSLGQYLASLKMNLDRLLIEEDYKERLVSECSAMIDQCLAETRTISHLLHPPLLDEAGFGLLLVGTLMASPSAAASA
jgi:PAS domain S-box-containing protein